MSIPDFQSLMLPVLTAMATEQRSTRQLVDAMAAEHGLTAEESASLLPSGRQTTIANRVHWAVAYLSRAELITRVSRGVYVTSDRGRGVLQKPPGKINIAFLRRFPEFSSLRPGEGKRDAGRMPDLAEAPNGLVPQNAGTPVERLEAAYRDLKAETTTDLIKAVQKLSPAAFEDLIIDVLVKIGYGGSRQDAAQRLGRSGDGGIDGVIREDVLGLDRIYIQAKRYGSDNSVSAPAIQGFAGALLGHGATKGVFVTTSRFTAQARAAADAYRAHRIVLLDGEALAGLMIEHEVGVRTTQTIHVQKIDLDAYESDDVG